MEDFVTDSVLREIAVTGGQVGQSLVTVRRWSGPIAGIVTTGGQVGHSLITVEVGLADVVSGPGGQVGQSLMTV